MRPSKQAGICREKISIADKVGLDPGRSYTARWPIRLLSITKAKVQDCCGERLFLSTWCAHFPLPIMEFFVTFLLPCQSAEIWTPGVPRAEGDLPGEPEAS